MTTVNKPQTQIIIDREEHQSLDEFATLLETIAKKLKEQGSFTLVEGNEETHITPNEQLEVEYSYEIKGDKHSFEIEFDWYTGEKAPKKITIK